MQHKKTVKEICKERITYHKKLVNIILSIQSVTGGIKPISGSGLRQSLNYYAGVRCGQ